jgi:hypothetical protein
MGSVVTRKINEDNVIISGFPAAVMRDRTPADYHNFDVNTIV